MDSLTNLFRGAANLAMKPVKSVANDFKKAWHPKDYAGNAVRIPLTVAKQPLKAAALPFTATWDVLYKNVLDPQTAIERGWNYAHEKPALSEAKKKELMEASALETPRSTAKALWGILSPYWTKSGPKEIATGGVLLATSLYMTWYAVAVTVEFSQWLGQMTDTLVNMGNSQTELRPDAVQEVLRQFPGVGEVLQRYPVLEDITLKYPDALGIFNGIEMGQINTIELSDIVADYPGVENILAENPMVQDFITQPLRVLFSNPEYRSFLGANQELFQLLQTNPAPDVIFSNFPDIADQIQANPELVREVAQFSSAYGQIEEQWQEILTTFPSLEEIFRNYPGLEDEIKADPSILNQITDFKNELGQVLQNSDEIRRDYQTVGALFGADFFNTWEQAFTNTAHNFSDLGVRGTLQATWNTVQNIGTSLSPFTELNHDTSKVGLGHAMQPFKDAWNNGDFATIALKYTGMALIAFKAKQYLGMRWRAWSTGYYANKWMNNNAFQRIKNQFSNVDNPDQRLQDDPAIFTAAAISISTGLLSAGMTFYQFSEQLWDMGSLNLMIYGGPDLEIPGAMMMFSVAYAAAITGVTMKLGWKLPMITRAQQKLEGDFRSSMKLAHEFADNIALEGGEKLQLDTIKKNFKPLMQNSVRDLTVNTKMIVADTAFGNFAFTVPKLIASGMIGAGQMTVGGMNTLGNYFGRITGSISFIANRWSQLTHVKATADRIYMMDRALEAAHYLETEKDFYAERETAKYLDTVDVDDTRENIHTPEIS